MDVWEIMLYAFGTFLALRVLVALMQQHRRYYLRKLAAEYQQVPASRRTAEQAAEQNAEEAGQNAT